MENKLVSIIIPTYNRAQLIGETIVSIQNQSYSHWECIIIDDESTDNTEEVILRYIKNDSRISFYKKPLHLPKGPSAARNYGFTKSKGFYINWFDSDDLMHPEKLETDLKYIISGVYDFTISQSSFFKDKGLPKREYWNKAIWSEEPINDFICKKIGWGINSPLWRREGIEDTNLTFDEQLMTADDYLYHIQALEYGLKPVCINRTLVSQREHPNRLTDYRFKSPSKLRVNSYLMLNKEKLNLNNDSLDFLKRRIYSQIINLLKHRDLKLTFYYLKHIKIYKFGKKQKMNLYRNLLIGIIYTFFGYGYRFFK